MKTTDSNSASAGRLEINWRKGINCYFDVDGITISVWASGWNGMEEVRVDGRLVSRQRVLLRSSSHRFSAGGVDYEIRLTCLSMLTGTFEITLARNGVEIDSDQASPVGPDLVDEQGNLDWSRVLRKIGPVFLLSGLAGMAVGYLIGKLYL
jgi:hypothetical protein